jgi:hypothetical protein
MYVTIICYLKYVVNGFSKSFYDNTTKGAAVKQTRSREQFTYRVKKIPSLPLIGTLTGVG